MPRYRIKDNESGRTAFFEGDAPPTEEQAASLFAGESFTPLPATPDAFAREQAEQMTRQAALKAMGDVDFARQEQADAELKQQQEYEDMLQRRLESVALKATPSEDAVEQLKRLEQNWRSGELEVESVPGSAARAVGQKLASAGRGVRNWAAAPFVYGVGTGSELIRRLGEGENIFEAGEGALRTGAGMAGQQLTIPESVLQGAGAITEPTADNITPWEEGIAPLGNYGIPSRVMNQTLQTAPQLAGAIGGGAMGIPMPLAVLPFGLTEEGWDTGAYATALAIPPAGRLSGMAAERALIGAGAPGWGRFGGTAASMGGPAAGVYAKEELGHIQDLPEEQRAEARREAVAGAAGLAMMGPPAYRGRAPKRYYSPQERLQRTATLMAERDALRQDPAVMEATAPDPQKATRLAELEEEVGTLTAEEARELSQLGADPEVTGLRVQQVRPGDEPQVAKVKRDQTKFRRFLELKGKMGTGLSRQETKVIQEAAAEAGVEVEVDTPDMGALGENEPFSRGADSQGIFRASRRAGKVMVNPQNFREWMEFDLAHMTPEQKAAEVKLQLALHEKLHLAADPSAAKSYWNAMSEAERRIAEMIYFGPRGAPNGYSKSMIAEEVMRMRVEKLAKADTTEVRTLIGPEGLTVKSLTMLQTFIRGARAAAGSKGAKALNAYDEALFRRLNDNIEYAKKLAQNKERAGVEPESRRRGRSQFEEQQAAKLAEMKWLAKQQPEEFQPAAEAAAEGLAPRAATPNEISGLAQDLLRKSSMEWDPSATSETQPGPPSFDDFVARVNARVGGPQHAPEQLFETWSENVGQWLMEKATDDQILSLVDKLKLNKELIPKYLRKQGIKPTIAASNVTDRPGYEVYRARQLKRAEQLDKRASEIESEIASIERGRATAQRKQQTVSQSELLPASELQKLSDRAELDRVAELRARAEEMRQRSKDITMEVRSAPTKITRTGRLVERYETKPAPEESMETQSEVEQFLPLFNVRAQNPDPQSQTLASGTGGPRLKGEGAGPQAARVRMLDAIFARLTERGEPAKDLNRKDITAEDIDWAKGPESVVEVVAEDLDSPDLLGLELTKGAGSDRSTKTVAGGGRRLLHREAPLVSHTKAIVALLDKQTGEVHLVSGYRDGRRGPVFRSPSSPADAHVSMGTLMNRYRPLLRYLVDSPVQSFRKRFASLEEFNSQLGNAVRERAEQMGTPEVSVEGKARGPRRTFADPDYGASRGRDPMAELHAYEEARTTGDFPSEVTRGQGGSVVGKHRDIANLSMGMMDAALDSGVSLTQPEAREAYRAFSAVETQADVRNIISGLASRARREGNVRRMRARVEEIRETLESQIELQETEPTKARAKQIERKQKWIDRIEKKIAGRELLTAKDRLLISAIRKVEDSIIDSGILREKGYENVTSDTLALNKLYDLAKYNPTQEGAVARATREFSKGPELPPEPAARTSPTARELVAPRQAAPIESRQQLTPEQRASLEQMPPREQPSEMLTPQEQEALASRISSQGKESKYQPSVPWETVGKEVDPQSIRRAIQRRMPQGVGHEVTDFIRGFGSQYDEWMTQRIARKGGMMAKGMADTFEGIIDRRKQLYGSVSKVLDEARDAAGGTRRFPIVGQVPTIRKMKAAAWLHGLDKKVTPYTAQSRTVGAIEGTIPVPAHAQELVSLGRRANLEIGKMLQPVIPGFQATGKFARNMTAFAYDLIRRGEGVDYDHWVKGLARANRNRPIKLWTPQGPQTFYITEQTVRRHLRQVKRVLDDPLVTSEKIEQVNQDMARFYPEVITHLKTPTGWTQLMHSDLFNYLENAAQRAAHVRAFREVFPKDATGRQNLERLVDGARSELDASGNADVDGLLRTIQGHPTDNYSNMGPLAPTAPAGQAFRLLNSTVGNLMSKMVLTGQMLTQPGEVLAGATIEKLGMKNYLRSMARIRQTYSEMEKQGAVNRAMYDFSFDPTSPVRSLFRSASNTISKGFAEQFLNEFQEAAAAATARTVAQRIQGGALTKWEQRNLPQTFKEMGFTPAEVGLMMSGDADLLGQFERRASAFLTGGNRSMSEGSRLGANRLFNSVFRFQLYPMTKMNQFREVAGNFSEAFFEGKGTPAQKRAAAERMARFVGFNTLQGALTVGITTLGFSGWNGAKIKSAEAQDEPAKFLIESMLSSMSGPLYMVWRGARNKGVLGVGDQLSRAIFPWAIAQDILDMTQGEGIYRDKNTGDTIIKFVQNKTPGTKAIRTGMSFFGLGTESRDIDNALSAVRRWKVQQYGYKRVESSLTEDARRNFRVSMGKVLEAIKAGDEDAYQKAMEAAMDFTPEGDVFEEAWNSYLSRHKIMVDVNGKELTPEAREDLLERIGEDAYDRAQGYDDMIEELKFPPSKR